MLLAIIALPGILLGLLAGLGEIRLRLFAIAIATFGFGGWYLYEHFVGQPACRRQALGDCVLGPAVPIVNAIAFAGLAVVIWVIKLLMRPQTDPERSPINLG